MCPYFQNHVQCGITEERSRIQGDCEAGSSVAGPRRVGHTPGLRPAPPPPGCDLSPVTELLGPSTPPSVRWRKGFADVCSAAATSTATRGASTAETYLLTVLEAGSLSSGGQPGRVPVRALFSACRPPPSQCVPTWPFLWVPLCGEGGGEREGEKEIEREHFAHREGPPS